MKKIILLGIAPFLMELATSFVSLIMNNSLKIYGGDLAIGAMTAVTSIVLIFIMPIFGINQGSQPIIGYNYGAKQYDRVKETVKYGAIAATIIVVIGWIVTQSAPQVLIAIFNNDPELVGIATNGIKIYLLMMPLVGFQVISSNYFQSIGKAKISMFLSLLRQVILLIPCILILPKIFGLKWNMAFRSSL